MILGMSTATYTLIHVLISLIAIASGFVVMYGLLGGKRLDRMTALFLTTTVLTSVTGFGFPMGDHLSPANKLGIISLVVLAIAVVARYPLHLGGGWRRTYVISAAMALYLNTFVLVVQSFEKVPALKAMAPTQKAVFGRATRRSGALRRANDFRGEEVPQRSRVPAARSAGKAA